MFSVWYVGHPADPNADCLFTTRLPSRSIAEQVAAALKTDFGFRSWVKED